MNVAPTAPSPLPNATPGRAADAAGGGGFEDMLGALAPAADTPTTAPTLDKGAIGAAIPAGAAPQTVAVAPSPTVIATPAVPTPPGAEPAKPLSLDRPATQLVAADPAARPAEGPQPAPPGAPPPTADTAAIAQPKTPAPQHAVQATLVAILPRPQAAPVATPDKAEEPDTPQLAAKKKDATAKAKPGPDAPAIATADAPQATPIALTATVQPAHPHGAAGAASTGKADGVQAAGIPAASQPLPSQGTDFASLAPQPAAHDNLPAMLTTQVPAVASTGSVSAPPHSYAAAAPQPFAQTVAAEPGRIGRDIGVAIARHVAAGRDDVLIRLDPAEMGRIDVRLSFDAKGSLHAAVSADSPAALDMLRRDAGDLGRSLADAGIRTDVSSFSFDSRGGHAGQFAQQQQGQRGHDPRGGGPFRSSGGGDELGDLSSASYRQLRASGRIDLMA